MQQFDPSDLTDISIDDFVSYLFDRGDLLDSQKQRYHDIGVEFDPPRMCAYYVQLFRQPEYLLARFSKPQLEEGFWAILGPVLECFASPIIHNPDIPLTLREQVVRSMADLFERFFVDEPLDTSVQMWWDSFCYDWHCGNRNRERGGEDLELQDIFFPTFAKVLAIDSWICQGAALHDLSHLHHPETEELIERFSKEHPSLTDEQKTYALAAAQFRVL